MGEIDELKVGAKWQMVLISWSHFLQRVYWWVVLFVIGSELLMKRRKKRSVCLLVSRSKIWSERAYFFIYITMFYFLLSMLFGVIAKLGVHDMSRRIFCFWVSTVLSDNLEPTVIVPIPSISDSVSEFVQHLVLHLGFSSDRVFSKVPGAKVGQPSRHLPWKIN